MTNNRRTPALSLATRLYRLLVLLLPREISRSHGDDMVQTFRDIYRAEYARGGIGALASVWKRAVIQTVAVAVGERLHIRASKHQVPANLGNSSYLDQVLMDAQFATRSYLKKPGFSLTAVGIIGLGIGASTAVFSVVNGVALKRLPYPEPNKLIYFDHGSHTVPDFRMWQERATSFDQIVAVWPRQMDMLGEGTPTRVNVGGVTPGYFELLGVGPYRGRLLQSADSRGPTHAVVLSHHFWETRLGSDEAVVGRTLQLDDVLYEVVGVAPPGFRSPQRVSRQIEDMWRPEDLSLAELQRESMWIISVFGRLADGALLETAQAEVNAVMATMFELYPEQYDGWDRTIPLISMHEAEIDDTNDPLFMLLGAVGLMLLIACTNVANLFLARGADRKREIAVRTAVGATRARIASQLLTESVLLSALGGMLGILIAFVSVGVFLNASPTDIPRLHEIAVDSRVMLFAVGVSLITGVIFGLAPAFYATRTDTANDLKDGAGRMSATKPHQRLKNTLVVGEIAIALTLLVGAGLLFNSLVRLTLVDPGFSPQQTYAIQLSLESGYDDEARIQFARQVIDRVHAMPGVSHSAVGWIAPFTQDGRCCWMSTGRSMDASDSTRVVMHSVTPNYFQTLGVPLLSGRDFDWTDNDTEPVPVIISSAFADRVFENEVVMGNLFTLGRSNPTPCRVIGVVDDMMFWSLSSDRDVDVYLPFVGFGGSMPFLTLTLRTAGDGGGLPQMLREAIWSIDPRLPIPEILSLESQVNRSIATPRLISALLMAFAGFAIVLAAGGIYGTMLFSVTQRQQELGIRLALGASAAQIVRFVVRDGLIISILGLGIGLAGSIAGSRILASALFGITPHDWPTYAAVTLLLGAVALVASYVPARRVTSMDPVRTLREE